MSFAAFDALLGDLEDLSLDTPDATEVCVCGGGVLGVLPLEAVPVSGSVLLQVVGTFLARAVADDCVPPLYLGKNPLPNELAKLVGSAWSSSLAFYTCLPSPSHSCRGVFKRANLLVNMKHGMARLDSVWGVGGGQWPVKTLVRQVLIRALHLYGAVCVDMSPCCTPRR